MCILMEIPLQGLESRDSDRVSLIPGDDYAARPSLYSSYVNSLVRQIGLLTRQSILFNLVDFQQFGEVLGRRYVTDRSDPHKPCWIKNPRSLDFELLIKGFMESHSKQMLTNDKITNRDFTVNGNVENSIIANLFKFYIGLYALEECLKSCFMFSNFGSDGVLQEQMIVEHIVKSVSLDIENILTANQTGRAVIELIKEMTLEENTRPAIVKLVTLNLNLDIISDFVANFSELEYRSFKAKILHRDC